MGLGFTWASSSAGSRWRPGRSGSDSSEPPAAVLQTPAHIPPSVKHTHSCWSLLNNVPLPWRASCGSGSAQESRRWWLCCPPCPAPEDSRPPLLLAPAEAGWAQKSQPGWRLSSCFLESGRRERNEEDEDLCCIHRLICGRFRYCGTSERALGFRQCLKRLSDTNVGEKQFVWIKLDFSCKLNWT